MPRLCVIPGDGIGKEVIPTAVRVLQAVIPDLETIELEAGWECFLRRGVAVPEETLQAVREVGAALFGAVSSPAYKVDGYRSAILTMRQELGLYANLRPVHSLPRLSPRQDVDFLILRENSEGLYSGRERMEQDTAIAERVITRRSSERLAQKALEIMLQTGRRRMTIVHKANILPLTDGLFRDSVRQAVSSTAAAAQVEIDELLVDTAALKIIQQPQRFDLLITTNLFGDILSDEAAYWCGGMGLAPSLNWGNDCALAEPVHGSAPDIAGAGIANPIAAILSAALLARYQWQMSQAAALIESAVFQALAEDIPVIDGALAPQNTTELVTNTILSRILQSNPANLAQTENQAING